MRQEEEIKAMFVGKDTCFITYIKEEDNKVWIRKRDKDFPFRKKWVVAFHNVKEHMRLYEEQVLFDYDIGRTNEKIRVYFMDFDTLEPYYSKMNSSLINELKNLKNERNVLYQQVMQLKQLISDSNNDDKLRKKIKDIVDFANNIKPQFVPNENIEKKK
jgi:hypothetical protein